MSDKSLRFMDKTQLLNIMRQQELEIERLGSEVEQLVSGREGQIENVNYVSEELLAERDAQIRELGEEIIKMAAEKNGKAEAAALEFERLSAEKSEQSNHLNAELSRLGAEISSLNADISLLKAENEELAALKGDSGQVEALIAEKDEQIERQNARIIRLTVEKDEQGREMEKLTAENSRQGREMEKLTAEKEELAKLSSAAAESKKQPQFALENPGSIAEASISVAGVMQAAQDAADLYLQNIKVLEAEKAAAAEKIEQEAEERAAAIIKEAELHCAELEEAEKKALGDLRSASFLYMDFIDKSHSALHEMIERYKLTKLTQND
ncbi:MAG: hypothetical protein FWG34_00225 [Oscillospiraceae bacterium]|nr:hypothetical protein [Oscillospiraceae bacterium]